MPRTKSARKALRSSAHKRRHNLERNEAFKNLEREFRKVMTVKDREKATTLVARLYQAYDKAAKKGVISRQRAARKKRQYARFANSMK